MFQMSSFCPTYLGWDYPIEVGSNEGITNLNLNSAIVVDFSSTKNQDTGAQGYDHVKRSQSPQGTSSTDHITDPSLAKKMSHNASERVRRKKISSLYSALRALLPASDQQKKLSIPGTVVRIVEFIPELQKQVDNLSRKKEELLSRISARLHEDDQQKPIIKETNSKTLYSISTTKLSDKEMAIQISGFERMSISEALMLLENNGYLVVDVSSFQAFGGLTFFNIHVSMEGSYTLNSEKLKEALFSLQTSGAEAKANTRTTNAGVRI